MDPDFQLKINFDISRISSYLGRPKQNGTGFNWIGTTKKGIPISLFYDTLNGQMIGFLECQDRKNLLGIHTDSFGIGYIPVEDIAKYFIRNKSN